MPRLSFDLLGEPVADATENGMLFEHVLLLLVHLGLTDLFGTLGDHHDGEVAPPLIALVDLLADSVQAVRNFRDQDDVGSAGNSGVERARSASEWCLSGMAQKNGGPVQELRT